MLGLSIGKVIAPVGAVSEGTLNRLKAAIGELPSDGLLHRLGSSNSDLCANVWNGTTWPNPDGQNGGRKHPFV